MIEGTMTSPQSLSTVTSLHFGRERLPSLGLSLSSVLGDVADAGGPY